MTRNRPNIRVDAGGDVHLSADEVGRDKITNQPKEEGKEEGKKGIGGRLVSWVGTIPALVKLAEFLGLSVK